MESIIDEMETKLNSLTEYSNVDNTDHTAHLGMMYEILLMLKQPLKDQLKRRIYVENQAKRKPEALGNIRFTFQP